MAKQGPVLGRVLIDALQSALDVDPKNVRRVVIDIKPNDWPIVHVELLGDNRLLDVVRTLDGVEIIRKD